MFHSSDEDTILWLGTWSRARLFFSQTSVDADTMGENMEYYQKDFLLQVVEEPGDWRRNKREPAARLSIRWMNNCCLPAEHSPTAVQQQHPPGQTGHQVECWRIHSRMHTGSSVRPGHSTRCGHWIDVPQAAHLTLRGFFLVDVRICAN